jgi:hypothetical protein
LFICSYCSSRFLADIGVPAESIGAVLTRAPSLLEQDHEDLKTRVAYLISKRFAAEQIAHIVTHAPRWLCYAVKGIDGRLGYFQKTFGLTGIFSLILVLFVFFSYLSFGTGNRKYNFLLARVMTFDNTGSSLEFFLNKVSKWPYVIWCIYACS